MFILYKYFDFYKSAPTLFTFMKTIVEICMIFNTLRLKNVKNYYKTNRSVNIVCLILQYNFISIILRAL